MNAKTWTCVALATAFAVGMAQAQTTYTWTQTAGGAQAWTTDANWSGGLAPSPVSGDTVDFSTVNIAANTTLLLEAPRTAEIWRFGDTGTTYYNWTVTNNTITLAGTTPTINVVNNTATLVCILDGTAGLKKTGAGTLTLNNAFVNTFTGPIVLDGGKLLMATLNTIGSAGDITFTGSATLNTGHSMTVPSPTFNKSVTINSGATATINEGNQYQRMYFTGPLIGDGTLRFYTGSSGQSGILKFSCETNTFTGMVDLEFTGASVGKGLFVNSLPDSANPIRLRGSATAVFVLDAGVASPLLFNSRHIELNGTSVGGGSIQNNNATTTNTITINTDLLVTADGAKSLGLGGSNTGDNTFAGMIVNGTNAVISLVKEGNGKWILSGNNTFSGTTTVTAGTLVLAGSQCLSDTNLLSIASGKVVQLEAGVKEKVGRLSLAGVEKSAGIYGSSASSAPVENQSVYFTGTGLLYVDTPLPAAGTLLYLK